MKRTISMLLVCCMVLLCCPGALAAEDYTPSYGERQELEAFLSTFRWYPRDYSAAEPGAGTDYLPAGILSAIIKNPLPVDYSVYPVEQPDRSWSPRRDPLGRWNGYWRFSEGSVKWILTYVFGLSQGEIDRLNGIIDAGKDAGAYRYGGSYYSWPGGVGGGYDASIVKITRDDSYYRVTYQLSGGDGYWEDMGIRFAVFSKTPYMGRDYWTLWYDGETELAPDMPFLDVRAGAYYAPGVLWARSRNITSGTSGITFSPEDVCTRAQVVTFLWRARGCPGASGGAGAFRDVPAGAWYADAVSWAVESGITKGTSDTTFSPDAGCTRGQVVTFLWRAFGSPAPAGAYNRFRDVEENAWYRDAVLWAVEKGITNGTSERTFSPSDACVRRQIVTFLYRAYGGTDPRPSWIGTFRSDSGETLTVWEATGSQIHLTARARNAAGSWYEAQRVLTRTGSPDIACEPFSSSRAYY